VLFYSGGPGIRRSRISVRCDWRIGRMENRERSWRLGLDFLVDAEGLCTNRVANVGAMDLASFASGPIDVFVLESPNANRFDFRRIIFHLVAFKIK